MEGLAPGEARRRIESLEEDVHELREWQLEMAKLEGKIMVVAFLLGGAAGGLVSTIVQYLKR